MKFRVSCLVFVIALAGINAAAQSAYVRVEGRTFSIGKKPYYFVGANYWYGGLLGLETNERRGIERLRRELDHLKQNGVTNLRILAGAEGVGPMNGVIRVGPPLQPTQGKFDGHALDGLDLVLDEMRKRDMRAVIFLSNNWEWSGGWQQYLIWNKEIDAKWLTQKPDWDELRDLTTKFYSCQRCIADYFAQVRYVLKRKNRVNGRRYTADPTIMAWEIANEPRPMRPAANEAYSRFIRNSAALIRSLDKRHLITAGHEGRIGTESNELFESVHDDPNIDYLTIHIWPKNWGWLKADDMSGTLQNSIDKTRDYISDGLKSSTRLNKPLVIEEFGMPRDSFSFDPASAVGMRDTYFSSILTFIGPKSGAAGANFWAYGGVARPVKGQTYWKPGDELMGDPPMEEQGLNSVFDSDATTWRVIRSFADLNAK